MGICQQPHTPFVDNVLNLNPQLSVGRYTSRSTFSVPVVDPNKGGGGAAGRGKRVHSNFHGIGGIGPLELELDPCQFCHGRPAHRDTFSSLCSRKY